MDVSIEAMVAGEEMETARKEIGQVQNKERTRKSTNKILNRLIRGWNEKGGGGVDITGRDITGVQVINLEDEKGER